MTTGNGANADQHHWIHGNFRVLLARTVAGTLVEKLRESAAVLPFWDIARNTLISRTRGYPCSSESAARNAIEQLMGRQMSDKEWGEAKRRLIDFALILARWNSMPHEASAITDRRAS